MKQKKPHIIFNPEWSSTMHASFYGMSQSGFRSEFRRQYGIDFKTYRINYLMRMYNDMVVGGSITQKAFVKRFHLSHYTISLLRPDTYCTKQILDGKKNQRDMLAMRAVGAGVEDIGKTLGLSKSTVYHGSGKYNNKARESKVAKLVSLKNSGYSNSEISAMTGKSVRSISGTLYNAGQGELNVPQETIDAICEMRGTGATNDEIRKHFGLTRRLYARIVRNAGWTRKSRADMDFSNIWSERLNIVRPLVMGGMRLRDIIQVTGLSRDIVSTTIKSCDDAEVKAQYERNKHSKF